MLRLRTIHHISNIRYIILDDNEFGYKAAHMDRRWIQTNEETGLQKEHIAKAIELLNNTKGETDKC